MPPFAETARTLASRWKWLVPGSCREAARYGLLWVTHRLRLRRFVMGGEAFPYFFHDYNKAWTCERTVEVPVAARQLARCAGGRILEVGNVLAHYLPVRHEVVDKYEVAPGVTNLDVVELPVEPRYDLILSLSTLEHVGWDEAERDDQKILVALDRLKRCLRPGGVLLVSLPLNYNHNMDALIRARGIRFDEEHFLQRVSALNGWREVDRETALAARYGHPYVGANGLLIGLTRA